MPRMPKVLADAMALAGMGSMPPLRDYWREINRREREAVARERAERKARDGKRKNCQCEAYPWPHRPRGGLCRFPDPPLERWQPKPGGRPYRTRYAGLVRQIARSNGLHPIKDRAEIEALMPRVLSLARQLKQQCTRMKYRNMKIKNQGNSLIGYWWDYGGDGFG